MDHHFDVEIATIYGMLEAVLLNNLYFWIEHNRANDTNYHDGHYWTYNSIKAYAELFPYASTKKIRNALKHLEESGIIITGNYNASAYDRTTWYTLTDTGKSMMQKGQMHLPKRANENTQKGEPIPDNKQDKKTDNIYMLIATENESLVEAFKGFIEMRKKIKKPLTDRALKMIAKKLNGMADTDEEKIKILDQSILHGWQDVYPLKKEEKKQVKTRSSIAHREYDFDEMEKLLFNS